MRRLAHISDLRFGKVDSKLVLTLAEELDGFNPDLIVVTGDVTEHARVGEFEAARGFLDSLPFPRLVVPGNHDIAPLTRPVTRLLDPYGHYRRYFPYDLNSMFGDDEILVLGLNTVHPLRHREGTVSSDQIGWIESLVNHHPDRFAVLAAHHPIVHVEGGGADPRLRHCMDLVRTLERVGIKMLLTGYLRTAYTGPLVRGYGIAHTMLVAQASTATSTARGHRVAYNRILVENQNVLIDVRAWNGEGFTRERSGSFERRGGAWRSLGETSAPVRPPLRVQL